MSSAFNPADIQGNILSAYGKLGIRSRPELAAALAGGSTAAFEQAP